MESTNYSYELVPKDIWLIDEPSSKSEDSNHQLIIGNSNNNTQIELQSPKSNEVSNEFIESEEEIL